MKKIILCVLGALLIGALLFFMMNRGASRIPANLLGMWATTSAGYTDRYMIFQDESLVFGTGENSSDSYQVNRIREEDIGPEISYIIDYENDEKTKFKLKFVYTKGSDETIIINHLENIIWIRINSYGGEQKQENY